MPDANPSFLMVLYMTPGSPWPPLGQTLTIVIPALNIEDCLDDTPAGQSPPCYHQGPFFQRCVIRQICRMSGRPFPLLLSPNLLGPISRKGRNAFVHTTPPSPPSIIMLPSPIRGIRRFLTPWNSSSIFRPGLSREALLREPSNLSDPFLRAHPTIRGRKSDQLILGVRGSICLIFWAQMFGQKKIVGVLPHLT